MSNPPAIAMTSSASVTAKSDRCARITGAWRMPSYAPEKKAKEKYCHEHGHIPSFNAKELCVFRVDQR